MLTVEQKNLFNIADSTLKDSELCDVDTAEISRRLRFNKRIREI